MNMKRLNFLWLLVFALSSQVILSQEANLKAFYTLNLIRYIGWNDQAMQGEFTIAVIGNKDVAEQLRIHSAGKRFGHQDFVIKEYDRLEEVRACQVIYVGEHLRIAAGTNQLLRKAEELGGLIITESEGMTNNGSAVNFVQRNEGLRFELNSDNAKHANLQFSSRLQGMSAAINIK
jgi:hypothetical protein